MSNSVFQFIYSSQESYPIQMKDLEDILVHSRKNNQLHNITGILLYSEGTFLQLLEGEKQVVIDLYKKISKDTRHKNLSNILDFDNGTRLFNDWSMGFKKLNKDEFIIFKDYLFPTEQLIENKIRRNNLILEIMATFLE